MRSKSNRCCIIIPLAESHWGADKVGSLADKASTGLTLRSKGEGAGGLTHFLSLFFLIPCVNWWYILNVTCYDVLTRAKRGERGG